MRVKRLLSALAAGALLVVMLASPAHAELCEVYDPATGECVIEVSDPGDPGDPPPGDDGGPSTFTGCAAEAAGPPPGAPPPGGPWSWVADVCYVASVEVSRGAPYWSEGGLCDLAAGPLCGAPPPDPRVLAQQAIGLLQFVAPPVTTAPPQGSEGSIVGVAVWLWVPAESAGPLSATASAGAVSVTATARVVGVDWDMGDGATRNCGLGTPYPAGGSQNPSPDCGYTYDQASTNHVAGEGPWPISATSTWEITWTGGGMSGAETLELTSAGSMMVREVYVLNGD